MENKDLMHNRIFLTQGRYSKYVEHSEKPFSKADSAHIAGGR